MSTKTDHQNKKQNVEGEIELQRVISAHVIHDNLTTQNNGTCYLRIYTSIHNGVVILIKNRLEANVSMLAVVRSQLRHFTK